MPSIAPPRFQWHDLPCTPHNGERCYSIFVPQRDLNQDPELPVLGSVWSACPDWLQAVERVIPPLQGYKLRWHEKLEAGRLFYFGKVKTEAERQAPFLEWRVRRMHYWPTVLLKLWFETTSAMPLSGVGGDGNIVTAPRIFDRMKLRDGGQFPTMFVIRHYLSDEKWPDVVFGRIAPITDTVRWSFLGNSGQSPECLHPRVTIPSFMAGGQVLYGAGTAQTEIGGDLAQQEFPATAMEDWESYVVESTTTQVMGQWFREEVVALPPIDDREEPQ